MHVKRRLTVEERNELEALMLARNPDLTGPVQASVTRLHGFLTSIISGPMVKPSEWMPVAFGDDEAGAWDSLEQVKRAMDLVMRLNNEIATDLMGEFHILIDRLGDGDDALHLADDWCKGYVSGFTLREADWDRALEAPEIGEALETILLLVRPDRPEKIDPVEEPEIYAALLDRIPVCVEDIYDWWRSQLAAGTVRRAVPKIPPNAPCPCGSGKKYKRCCSPSRAPG